MSNVTVDLYFHATDEIWKNQLKQISFVEERKRINFYEWQMLKL